MDILLRQKLDCNRGRCLTSCRTIKVGQCLLHELPWICVSSSEYLQNYSINSYEERIIEKSSFPYAQVAILVSRWIKYQSDDLVQKDIINELSHTVESSADVKVSYSLCQAIRFMVSNTLSFASRLSQLYNDEELAIVIDKFRTNVFTIVDDDYRNIGVAMYANASLINHDCDPNCYQSFNKHTGELLIHSLRPIECDDHITISYIDCGKPLWWRRHALATQYGFYCTCSRCREEEEEAEAEEQVEIQNDPSPFADIFLCLNCTHGFCTVAAGDGANIDAYSNSESEIYHRWLACDGSLKSFRESTAKQMTEILSFNLNLERLLCNLSFPLGFALRDFGPDTTLLDATPEEMIELGRKHKIQCNACHSSRSLTEILSIFSRVCKLTSTSPTASCAAAARTTSTSSQHAHEYSKHSKALSLIKEAIPSNHCCVVELQYKLCRSLKQSILCDFKHTNELNVCKATECFSQFQSLIPAISALYAYVSRENDQRFKHITVVIATLDFADYIVEANNLWSVSRIVGNPQTLEYCLNLRYARDLYETAYMSLCISHGEKHTLTNEVKDKIISLS